MKYVTVVKCCVTFQLFIWLEKEIDVLKELCDYRTSEEDLDTTAEELLDNVPIR